MAKKLPSLVAAPQAKTARKKTRPGARGLRVAAPSAVTTRHHGGDGVPLQVVMPPETLKALKLRAIEQDSTVRVLVLTALKSAGFPVPPGELIDRRSGR